mgnify:FL=1|jgi:hypothetical protein
MQTILNFYTTPSKKVPTSNVVCKKLKSNCHNFNLIKSFLITGRDLLFN